MKLLLTGEGIRAEAIRSSFRDYHDPIAEIDCNLRAFGQDLTINETERRIPMTRSISSRAVAACLTVLFWTSIAQSQQQSSSPEVAESQQAMLATVHPLATEAGLKALANGGNAIDAAIAAALTLGVVDGYNSGIGGGCFILIRTADGQMIAIDGREVAPRAAHRDMFLSDGKPDTSLSQHGPLAVATPGALAAYFEAVRDYGNVNFAMLLAEAAGTAESGFVVSSEYATQLRSCTEVLQRFPGSAEVLLHSDGRPIAAGETLRQPDLANTYRQIAEHGTDWFYRGPFARQVADWMQAHGGVITEADFADYRVVRRSPLVTTYRGYEIVGFPPPSSGGVHVAQILNICESFDLASMHRSDPHQATHVIAEAMKLAFADRAYWLGDPQFAKVPSGLVDKEYAAHLAASIDLQQALRVDTHGDPQEFDPRWFDKHTTHVAAADSQGNWVALTTTVNTTFGSKVIVPGTGVILNNQMDDFAIAPGVPNAFGLIGSEANQVAAGKRPLSSMSPTIVMRDGEPVLTLGAAGGPKIITEVTLGIIRYLDFQLPIEDAVGLPRIHQQWVPDVLYLERGADETLAGSLAAKGHRIERTSAAGVCQAIVRIDGVFFGVADPRVAGRAAGR